MLPTDFHLDFRLRLSQKDRCCSQGAAHRFEKEFGCRVSGQDLDRLADAAVGKIHALCLGCRKERRAVPLRTHVIKRACAGNTRRDGAENPPTSTLVVSDCRLLKCFVAPEYPGTVLEHRIELDPRDSIRGLQQRFGRNLQAAYRLSKR
jgi:hypothetical protein